MFGGFGFLEKENKIKTLEAREKYQQTQII
jgi:hypothetical protein